MLRGWQLMSWKDLVADRIAVSESRRGARALMSSMRVASLIVLVAILTVATVFGVIWRRRSGRLRDESAGEVLTVGDLGADLGRVATLVQFSTEFCQPCRVTRGVLVDIAAVADGVRHIEVDAGARLDLVRRLNVLRTPTVLVLDAHGRIVNRASGAPRRVDMLAAVAAVSGSPFTAAVADACTAAAAATSTAPTADVRQQR